MGRPAAEPDRPLLDRLIGKRAGEVVPQFLATLRKTLEDAQIGIPTG
jgi:hypothetical protein